MRHFWALPAVVRVSLVLASQHSFSVHDDLLAFPQYRVSFPDEYLTEAQAQARLAGENEPRSTEDAQSQIEHYNPQPHDSHTPSQDASKEETKFEHERMTFDGHPYLCSIPQVTKPAQESRLNNTVTITEERKELARANNRGWELLRSMQGNNCLYFVGGWWSYQFCYNQGVRQFHQLPPSRGMPMWPPVEDPNVGGYQLGTYTAPKEGGDGSEEPKTDGASVMPEEFDQWEGESALEVSEHAKKMRTPAANGELVVRGDTRYLVQQMDHGTMCDLTGKPRRIEVQYHCHPGGGDRISMIKETSTCAYLMVVQTPRLCNDVAFLPPVKDQPNEIICKPVLSESEIPAYEIDLAALRSAEKEASLAQAKLDAEALLLGQAPATLEDTPQMAGDIVIGGHHLVPPGKKIERSAILGGGKETYIDTIMDSEGKMLSKKKLAEYGLDDEKAMKKLADRIAEAADGLKWKLDIVETPTGREYRGIIGDDDEDEKKNSKSGGVKGKDGGGGDANPGGAAADKANARADAANAGDGEAAQKGEEGSEEEYFYKEEL